MTRALLWLFFLADLAGIAWAVRVLVREAHRHLSWHLAQRRARNGAVPQPEAPPARGDAPPEQRSAAPATTVLPAPRGPERPQVHR